MAVEPAGGLQHFPDLRGSTFAVAAGICLGIFVFTLLLEWWRRVRERRVRLQEEWAEVHALMREKDLAEDQRDALVRLLRRHASRGPLKAVTRRSHFDACVSREIAALRSHMPVEELESAGEAWRVIRIALGLDFIPIGQSISSTRELYLHQHLWVAPATGGEPAQWHPAQVTRVNEAFFVVTLEDAGEPHVRDGAMVHCRLWREDDGRYAFDAKLVRAQNRPAGWLLRHTEDLRRTQSRAHYRISHEQPAEVDVVEAPLSGSFEDVFTRAEVARMHGRITSLSGGGFAVTLTQPLPQQVLLRLVLMLDEPGDGMLVAGRVVGSQSLFGGRYLIRCAFVAMQEEQLNHITHYVFRRQTQPRTETQG
jgi:hypothetical protein